LEEPSACKQCCGCSNWLTQVAASLQVPVSVATTHATIPATASWNMSRACVCCLGLEPAAKQHTDNQPAPFSCSTAAAVSATRTWFVTAPPLHWGDPYQSKARWFAAAASATPAASSVHHHSKSRQLSHRPCWMVCLINFIPHVTSTQ
jgi:hypothetical protein